MHLNLGFFFSRTHCIVVEGLIPLVLLHYWWKLIRECVSVHTHINTHDLSWCGQTTLQYAALICIVVKVMSLHLMQYDCEYAFTTKFLAIIIGYVHKVSWISKYHKSDWRIVGLKKGKNWCIVGYTLFFFQSCNASDLWYFAIHNKPCHLRTHIFQVCARSTNWVVLD